MLDPPTAPEIQMCLKMQTVASDLSHNALDLKAKKKKTFYSSDFLHPGQGRVFSLHWLGVGYGLGIKIFQIVTLYVKLE